MRLIPIAAAGALLFAAPALADSHMNAEQMPEKMNLSERCDRLAERFRDAEVQDGLEADVLEAEVLHERGTDACNGGNHAEGIELIQQALREIGAPAETEAN